MFQKSIAKTGVAGTGTIGSVVCKALADGIDGFTLTALSESNPAETFGVPVVDFSDLAVICDLVIECLPPAVVPTLAAEVFRNDKDLVLISSSALLMFPEILERHKKSDSRIIIPSGALAGLDGVKALAQTGIKKTLIATTKPPKGFAGAPFVKENAIDLDALREKTLLFSGNALAAAKGFPTNVNVAATLAMAGIGPEKTEVEIWADPGSCNNIHEMTVEGAFSRIVTRIENIPDPDNPKSSLLAAQSIISTLRGITSPLVVL